MFETIRQELGSAKRPLHYLAIPSVLFGTVVKQLSKSGCNQGARVVLEKPFGTDLASARELNRILLGTFPETTVFRIDHYPGNALSKICCISVLRMRSPRLSGTIPMQSVQITMAEHFGVQGRGGLL